MRNTLEHPITIRECADTLSQLAGDLGAEHLCGDMRPLILRTVADMLLDEFAPDTKLRDIDMPSIPYDI